MAKNPNWSSSEKFRLIGLYAEYSNIELTKFFTDRTPVSIQHAGNRLSLHKTPETIQRIFNENAIKVADAKRKSYKLTSGGYELTYAPSHPFSSKDGNIMQHRLVMEEHIGRYLLASEVVHHRNKKKSDNRIENLQLLSISEHSILHNTGRKYSPETIVRMSRSAKIRLSVKKNHPFYKEIPVSQFKDTFLSTKTIKEVCKVYGICKKTFYNKIEEFKLEEWYANVK